MNRNYVVHFPCSRRSEINTPWLSEDLNIWARGRVTESPPNWIMGIEMLSNP